MLIELRVQNLGVIDNAVLLFGSGLSALTGETGAGKTLVTESIGLLTGAKADSDLVRPGASEAVVEGRFLDPEGLERVVRRIVPAQGRSRAYLDGAMSTVAELERVVSSWVQIHGQHGQLAVLRPAHRREALDTFGSHDLEPYLSARRALSEADAKLEELGGDSAARAREIDLLRFQIEEIEAAALDDPEEDELLAKREVLLGDAQAHIQAASSAVELICADGPIANGLGEAIQELEGHAVFESAHERLISLSAEVADVADELRVALSQVEDDPKALAELQARREVLAGLRRKYGSELAEVIDFYQEAASRLETLENHDRIAAELDAARSELVERVAQEAQALKDQRTKTAKKLGEAVVAELVELALPRARIEISVEGEAGEDVDFLIAMNPGAALLPIAKAASGGELSRVMLSLALVLQTEALLEIYDEVDAGVGGEAATSIGKALAKVAKDRQVLVVTHLAQVAAYADNQIGISKSQETDSTTTRVHVLSQQERVNELARMLSGTVTDSSIAHAKELIALRAV